MKTNTKFCSWDGIIPSSSTGWGLVGWGEALPKRHWGLGRQQAEQGQQPSLAANAAICILAASAKLQPANQDM